MRTTRHMAFTVSSGIMALACASSGLAWASGVDVTIGAAVPTMSKADRATAAPRSKANGSGVTVNVTVPEKVAVGQTVTLRFNFNGVGAEGATAEVREPGANGRVLLSVQLPAGREHNADVSYQSPNDGLQFVDVITRQNGRTSVQQVAVPVGSGQAKLKPSGTEVVTPSGERLVTLPSSK